MRTRHVMTPLGLAAASALVLAGCATTPTETPGATAEPGIERLSVVASTNVYGQIAEEIGGEFVEVTSIVTSASQDPHSFEPSARDQLTIADADLIIENGGGYDAFVDALIEASGTTAPVITAVEFSHDYPGEDGHADDHAEEEHAEEGHAEDDHDHGDDHDHAEDEHAADDGHDHGHSHIAGFNEHVWYDPHTIEHVAEAIAEELALLDPENAEAFTANADAFIDEVAGLEDLLAEIEATDAGAQVFVTEPVPVYLVEAAGLDDVTPSAFSEAVEEGQDVPPATLLEALSLLRDGDVRVVIANTQTGGAETTQVLEEAEGHGIPVIAFSETLPEGQTYISWMQENIDALSAALAE